MSHNEKNSNSEGVENREESLVERGSSPLSVRKDDNPIMSIDPEYGRNEVCRSIKRIKGDRNIGWLDKRKLVAEQIEKLIKIETYQLGMVEKSTALAVSAKLDVFKLRLDESLMSVFEQVGKAVAMRKVHFLKELAVDLTTFKKEVDAEDIASEYREHVLKSADESFFQMTRRMSKMAADLIVDSNDH